MYLKKRDKSENLQGVILMNLKKVMSRFAAVFTASALMASAIYIAPENVVPESLDVFAASDCVIDTTKEYQTIRGFGGMNHPEWTGKDLTDSQRQTAFGNAADELGLTIVRIFVNPDKNQWNKAVPTAKYATEHGVTVFASPWEPPSNLAESGGTGGLKGKLHLPESNYGTYAQHLNDFGTYMKNQGVDLYSISVQNEPDYAEEWTAWTPEQTTNFIANYGDKITSTRLMSPESFQYGAWNNGKDYYKQILANSKAMANCDLFGTHFYGTPRSKMDFPELENCGKEIWMTEVYVPHSEADSANRWPEALDVSENIHNALVVGNMNAYTWWYIRRSYGLMDENGKITKRGYNMAHFSKWVRPGDIRIDATEQPADNVLISAYKNNNKQVTVVAINKSNSSYTQSFSIGSGEKIIDVDRYRTSANENIALTENLENNGSGFYAQLPAQSVSTFVVSLEGSSVVTPDEPETPNEYGWWFQCGFEDGEQGWTNRGGNSVAQSGSEHYTEWGSNSLLVSDREKSWQGAAYSLKPSVFKAGETYSFSAHVKQKSGENVKMMLKIEYTNADGETSYAEIDSCVVPSDTWAQLYNKNFTLPEGATNIKIYIETEDSLTDFYVDEVIGAVADTGIAGEGHPEISTPITPPPVTIDVIPGDTTMDKVIDSADMVLARQALLGKITDAAILKAADVDQSGKVEVNDLVLLQQYILGNIKEFPNNAPPEAPKAEMRTISEYTPVVQANVVEYETNDSKTTKPGVNYGTLEKKSYYSNFCGRNKKYNVLLPANYDKNKKYPVLYVMHGYYEDQDRMIITGNDHIPTQQIIGNAIADGAAKEMIVVFPYIYSSQTQDNCDGMNDANNQAYDNFDIVLTTELMPLIEKEYSVATGRENTAITGFSMGGRESLMIGMKHPDLFGYVGAICAAPGATGAFKFASEEEAPSLIFLTAGSNDETVGNTPEGYHNNFTSNGVPHIWHYVNGGYHGDNCIRAHIYNFIRAIFQA